MKPERITGTYCKTLRKLCMSKYHVSRPMVLVEDGRVMAGLKSAHLSLSGRRIAKLMVLRHGRYRR